MLSATLVFGHDAPQSDIGRFIADQTHPGRLSAGCACYRALLAGNDFFTKTVHHMDVSVLAIDGDHCTSALIAKSFALVAPKLRSVIAVDRGHFVQEEPSSRISWGRHS